MNFRHNNGVDPTARIAPGVFLGQRVTAGANVQVGGGARIGDDVVLHSNVIVEEGAQIGDRVTLDYNVVVRAGTRIGDDTVAGAGCVLGQTPSRAKSSTLAVTDSLDQLTIGQECQIGVGAVLYAGCRVGSGCFIADAAQIRERCCLGKNVIVGRGATVENDCQVGDGTRIQTGAYITAHSDLAENVFIAPMVTTTNDNYVARTEERFKHRKGVTVEKGGRIGGNAVILPGVTVHQEALVAAGSVVTKDAPPYMITMGVPARPVRNVPSEQWIYPPTPKRGIAVDSEAAEVPSFTLVRQNAALAPELMGAFSKVVASGHFILGEEITSLEEKVAGLCGVKHGIGVANGSDALYLALLALGIGPEDEVITTPFTFFATAGSMARIGAKPVFCDINPDTFNIDPDGLERLITPRTRAIMPVHLYGHPADMDPIREVARRHNLRIVEDAAQAIGGRYKGQPVGSLGDVACISFFPTKNLGAFGDGGMVVTDNDQVADRLRMLRVHGSRKKYYHELLGINSRLDALQAAVLNVKFPHLGEWTERRRELAAHYTEMLKGLPQVKHGAIRPPIEAGDVYHVYHQYTVRVRERDRLRQHLVDQGIETTVYYPLPLHLQPVFSELGYKEGDFPKSEEAAREALSLPMFPELTEGEQEKVIKTIALFK